MTAQKYPRTFHLPYSPGKSSDDKTIKSVDAFLNRRIVITEKLDGSNVSLEHDGCFARTHAHAPTHPSFDQLKALHAQLKWQLPKGFQFFGEYLFARHSIAYDRLPGYFLLFGVRNLNGEFPKWLSWEGVENWAEQLELPTVPVLNDDDENDMVSNETELEKLITRLAKEPSIYGKEREGVVVRVADEILDDEFATQISKWVRSGHVITDTHWMHQEIVKNELAKKE